MATIQIKRRTSSGTGPVTVGTIKAGEPLVDFSGGNLYIAKADKTGTAASPLTDKDYLMIPGSANVGSAILGAIANYGFGTAAKKNAGTSSGNVPVIGTDGKLPGSIMPKLAITNTWVVKSQAEMLALSSAEEGDVAVRTDVNKSFILKAAGYSTLANWQELLTPTDKVQSVNGKTGAVTISLSELGGASKADLSAHADNGAHLTAGQILIIQNAYNTDLWSGASMTWCQDKEELGEESESGALTISSTFDSSYTPGLLRYGLGVKKGFFLKPSDTIDGGTY